MAARPLVFKILGIACGLVFAVFSYQEGHDISRLKKIGGVAQIEPVGYVTDFQKGGSHTYTAEVTFKTDEGVTIHAKQSLPEGSMKDIQSGAPVRVFYDKRDPSHFVFEKDSPSWLMTIGGLLAAVGALVFL
jgi:hypothetical protein